MTCRFSLIGPGKVGSAVSRQLVCAEYTVQAVVGRDQERAKDACAFIGCPENVASTDLVRALDAPLILIAVPDDQIEATAAKLFDLAHDLSGTTLVHFSGLHSTACLKPEPRISAATIHPLLPFANRRLASQSLSNCPCAIEGDPQGIALAKEIVEAFSGLPFIIRSETKPLYHAAACIASNYLVTLTACARDLFRTCGVDESQALALLHPLLKATLNNVVTLGPERGLTGPIVRGDVTTIFQHIEALKAEHPDSLELYRTLGEQTIALAQSSQSLSTEAAEEIATILSKNHQKSPKIKKQ